MKQLEVENLSCHFTLRKTGWFEKKTILRAVDKISFHVDAGETVGLVGESGSGKTTTAKLILKLLQPNNGLIRFENSDILSIPDLDYRKNVQVVFQNPYSSLNPRHSVHEILREATIVHFPHFSHDEIENRIRNILEDVKLPTKRLYNYPHEFSGGERQRIAIARALCVEPKLLILDEPVSSLDVSIQAQIINLLINLQKKHNMTYLFISHDLHVVRFLCNRVYVMKDGIIVEEGTTEKIFTSPSHEYTKTLLDSIFTLPQIV